MFSLVCNQLHFDRTSVLASLTLFYKSKKRMFYFIFLISLKPRILQQVGKLSSGPHTYLAGQLRTGATVRAGCLAGAAQGNKALSPQLERQSLRRELLWSQSVAQVCKAAASPLPDQSHTPGRTPHKPT